MAISTSFCSIVDSQGEPTSSVWRAGAGALQLSMLRHEMLPACVIARPAQGVLHQARKLALQRRVGNEDSSRVRPPASLPCSVVHHPHRIHRIASPNPARHSFAFHASCGCKPVYNQRLQSPVLNVCSQLTSKATGLLLVVATTHPMEFGVPLITRWRLETHPSGQLAVLRHGINL